MVNHIAIIPDGNRRWAKKRGLPETSGVIEGAKRVVELVRWARSEGVHTVTFWGFSTENWKRSPAEVKALMELFEKVLDEHVEEAKRDGARITHMGRKDRLTPSLLKKIIKAQEETAHFTKYHLNIALDYGGHDELMRAVNKALADGIREVSEETFAQYLDTASFLYPNPDMIIRTSAELRLSGFMPWQSAYSELFFVRELFPDFTPDKLKECIEEFKGRSRRFGK